MEKKSKVNIETPETIKFLDLVETPEFEEALTNVLGNLKWSIEHKAEIAAKAEELKQQAEFVSSPQVKQVVEEFSDPGDFTIAYMDVVAKKSKLPKHKREVIGMLGESIAKSAAMAWTNHKKEEEKAKEALGCAAS